MIKCALCPLYGRDDGCPGKLTDGACVRKLQEKLKQLMPTEDPSSKEQASRATENLFYRTLREELAKLAPPELPAFRVNLKKWNGTIYGSDGNWAIVIEGNRYPINNTEYMILSRYEKAYREYKNKVSELKHGIGIHKEAVCPVCGKGYVEISPLSTSDVSSIARKKWTCTHCGSRGSALYRNSVELKYLTDHNGNKLNRKLDGSNCGKCCPNCGKGLAKVKKFTTSSRTFSINWTCNGAYDLDGCHASGTFFFTRQFWCHADVQDKNNNTLWN